jgi:tetratricopeptide (TPR) repeat protein
MKQIRIVAVLAILSVLISGLTACSKDPNVRKQKYLESGIRYLEKSKYREAAIQFQNALQVDAKFAEAHYQLAQAHIGLKNAQAAFESLRKAVAADPNHLKAQIEYGNLCLVASARARNSAERKEALDAALAAKDKALAIDANSPTAHALAANLLAYTGDHDGAITELRRAIELDPKEAKFLVNLAAFQRNLKRYDDAEATLKKATEVNPSLSEARFQLATYYLQKNRLADAEQQYRAAIEKDPENATARAYLANYYRLRGDRPQAEAVLTQAKKDLASKPAGYRMLGDFYIALGDIDHAVQEFGSLYQEHPKDLTIKKNYIELLIAKGRIDEANKLNEEILKSNAKDVEGLILRGRILVAQGQFNAAIQPLELALRSEPENVAAHYNLGVAYAGTGNTSRAEDEWRQALRTKDEDSQSRLQELKKVPVYLALANAGMRDQDANSLTEIGDRLVSLQPLAPEGYVTRATANVVRKDFRRAEIDFDRAVQVAPNNPMPLTKMAKFRLVQGRTADAEKLLQQALAKASADPEATQTLIGIYVSQKQGAKALAVANEQAAKAPNSPASHFLRAQAEQASGNSSSAKAALQKAIDLNNRFSDAYNQLAQLQASAGEVDAARATLAKWVQNTPYELGAYIATGTFEEGQKNFDKAQAMYQKALELNPNSPVAANNLAYLMLERGGNLDQALALAQTARRGMPESPSSADTLAWAYYKKGVYGSAIELLEQAIQKQPKNATYHFHIGLAYQQKNDQSKAATHLKKALELNPEGPHAAAIKDALAKGQG